MDQRIQRERASLILRRSELDVRCSTFNLPDSVIRAIRAIRGSPFPFVSLRADSRFDLCRLAAPEAHLFCDFLSQEDLQ